MSSEGGERLRGQRLQTAVDAHLLRPNLPAYRLVMATVQQRKAEILAKRAKLAELKRQRELRQKEFNQNRTSVGDASEVKSSLRAIFLLRDSYLDILSGCLPCPKSIR